VPGNQVVVLLVGECLDGCCVEALAALFQGEVDGELPHHGLARSRRGRDEDASSGLDGLAGPHLEVVKREVVATGEPTERTRPFGPASPRGRVPLRGRAHTATLPTDSADHARVGRHAAQASEPVRRHSDISACGPTLA
jgi:hypothetical protein